MSTRMAATQRIAPLFRRLACCKNGCLPGIKLGADMTLVRSEPWTPQDPVIGWLLESDPAIRWQVVRDLLDAPPDAVAAERAQVATRGWGARLLAMQGADGNWNGAWNHGWDST